MGFSSAPQSKWTNLGNALDYEWNKIYLISWDELFSEVNCGLGHRIENILFFECFSNRIEEEKGKEKWREGNWKIKKNELALLRLAAFSILFTMHSQNFAFHFIFTMAICRLFNCELKIQSKKKAVILREQKAKKSTKIVEAFCVNWG
jgi:hypothetical protein